MANNKLLELILKKIILNKNLLGVLIKKNYKKIKLNIINYKKKKNKKDYSKLNYRIKNKNLIKLIQLNYSLKAKIENLVLKKCGMMKLKKQLIKNNFHYLKENKLNLLLDVNHNILQNQN